MRVIGRIPPKRCKTSAIVSRRYGNPYSPGSLNNPYGAGNPYANTPSYVVPEE